MKPCPRPPCAPAALLVSCVLTLLGCGGVREDRSITFSADGSSVGFQHGTDGVFVADKEGAGLTKIHAPDKDVIAVGTPLWAPNDRRLIFTTARAVDRSGTAPVVPGSEEDPAGRLFDRTAAVYTCWLRDEPKGGAGAEPRTLFTAPVEEVGYVAAGLAVRWHPNGGRVCYVMQVDGGHAVFEFDLATRVSRRVFPDGDGAGAVIFDWTPDGSHLVCLVADATKPARDGIWVGRDGEEWWHVAESIPTAEPVGFPLERLKSSRPVWTADGRRFAFVTARLGESPDEPTVRSLWTGTPKGHRIERVREAKEAIRDLAWHPDGRRLGFVTGGETGALWLSDPKEEAARVAPAVRSFAGWDRAGEMLAYTTADDIALSDEAGLSLLLFPDPLARDILYSARADGRGAATVLKPGLRTTFARWSPTDGKLSQWFTFCPTHRSILSRGVEWGLPRGDPAAVIDARTGAISWLAVDAHEKAQIGHYHLLRRDYPGAWRWYEQAERERAGAGPEPTQADPGRRRPFRDPSFFEYYCLDKLRRRAEAWARLQAFRKRAPALLPPEDPRAAAWVRQDIRRLAPLARDFYAAEVFLSLDAAEDAEAFFHGELADAGSDDDRLSAAVMLSQVLLLRGRTAEYAALATETLAPLVLRAWQAPAARAARPENRWAAQPLPVVVGSLALLPLCRPDLLARLPQDGLNELAGRWTTLRAQAPDAVSRLGADVILEGLYRQLRRDREADEVHQRIGSNPQAAGHLVTPEALDKLYREVRGALEFRGLAVVFEMRTSP
jgi:hypothetical protein